MATESDIINRESGGNPNIGYGGVDLTNAPRDQYGFPIWEGKMGPEGISHAAGLHQWEPKTWAEAAQALGLKDMSAQSQHEAFNYMHAKYGDAPWAASAPGYKPKLQPEGLYGGSLHVNVRPDEDLGIGDASAALLSSILASHYPTEDKSTGNGLLDGIMSNSVLGIAKPEAPQPIDIEPLKRATPETRGPETEPELSPGKQVDVAPLEVPPPPAAIPSTPPSQQPPAPEVPAPHTEPDGFIEPPGKGEIVPRVPPPQPSAPQAKPVIQPTPLTTQAGAVPAKLLDTGNSLLTKILHGSPFATGPHAAAALIGNLLTRPDQARSVQEPIEAHATPAAPIDQLLTGIGVTPPATTDIQRAQAEQQAAQAPSTPLVGTGPGGALTGRIAQLAEAVTPMIAGGAPGGALSSGIRIPRGLGERIEPTLGEVPRTEPPAIGGGGGGGGPPEPPEPPKAMPMPPPPGVKAEAQSLDDDLFQASQSATADKLEVQKIVEGLPKELKGEADTRSYHERESRMTGKPTPPSATTQEIEHHLAPLDAQIHEDATWLQEHAPDLYKAMPERPLRTAAEGHVHRKVVGQKLPGEPLNPSEGDIISGIGAGSLSRKASGMMHRSGDFVLEDNAGNRVWGRGPKVGDKRGPARYGETIADARTGTKYTVKEPTTAEITANTGRQYIDSLLGNTIDNFLRLSAVRRNVEILEKWKPRLEEAGNWYPEASQANRPANFVHVDVPQLRGWAAPHIAAVLNDAFRTSRDDLVGFLQKVNKVLVGSMFALPVRHQLNVATHYAVGRGFDWVYRDPQLARAYTQVATQGPDYLRYLRAGAGLRYGGPLTENFYNTLLSKLFHDQMTDPEWQGVFKELGVKGVDLVKAEYALSRRILWKYNDVFLTARIMEFEKAGKPLPEAIRLAEKEIPNYRLPTNNLMARRLINSPLIAFGRYGYGRAKALADTAKNLVGPNATGEERLRALGQALMMVAIGTEGYKVANHALATAQQQVSQALGPKWGPRVAGDPNKPLVMSGVGPMGPVMATGRFIGSMMGLNEDEKNWANLLGSWISLAPAATLPVGIAFGKDPYSGQNIMDPNASKLGHAVEGGEFAGGLINPIDILVQSARKGLLPGIGPQLGFQQQYTGPQGRIQHYLRRQAAKREARDPIEQGIKSLTGQ